MVNEKICPYPGLRPFSEDESIYFKGREDHIDKIIARLEKNKFVMLTGASGDGKSSIVYAGVIPNARAGFFKAKFNNWVVADFRPDRSPLKNLSTVISEKLEYNNTDSVEKELGYGFSKLISLYKNSPFHLDTNSEEWRNADDNERKKLKRKAANLFILVDQFEEFFTNPENYQNGKPSANSMTVVNLLLETAKIALEQDLPIYIICTMRSDYIGQCATFRGLPEYIGFSQFFVPRLKRKEIHQVIEEPAILSGNAISNRLIETLINGVGEGFDQLPILQHALNSLWHAANNGHEEMDLIHLAMIGGLSDTNLSKEEKVRFDHWLSKQPEFYKKYFVNFSLEQSLSANTNILYETADTYYNATHEQKISKTDAQLILKNTFQSLTKIDDSRAVRNRITLQEITDIINQPNISTAVVGGVINIYREQGNFVKPFITKETSSHQLKDNEVLDITHESLIRNWDLLKQWVDEESENRANYLDFYKQIQRWVNGGRTQAYLLAKGPLAFFESWYVTSRINMYWLVKYDQSELSQDQKKKIAAEQIKNAEEFLKKSNALLKLRRRLILSLVSGVVVFVLLGLTYALYGQKVKTKKIEHLKFGELQTKVIAPSSFVSVGEEYKADIFLLTRSSQFTPLEPKIFLGKFDVNGRLNEIYDTVSVQDGMGSLSVKTSEPGEHLVQGEYQIKSPSGLVLSYPFEASYKVARSSVMISADQMNVFYAGIKNPISIGVAGIAPADLVIKTDRNVSIEPVGPGHYDLLSPIPQVISISVLAKMKGQVIPMGPPVKFRVKPMPDPTPVFGTVKGSSKINKQLLLSTPALKAVLFGFDFNTSFTITSFELVLIRDNETFKLSNSSSGEITGEMRREFKKLTNGNRIIFSNIEALGTDGLNRELSPVVLELTGELPKDDKTETAAKVFIPTTAEKAEFPGGAAALKEFIQESIKYPAMAQEGGVSGKCLIKFLVNEDGSISNVEVAETVPGCPECDDEAIRVIKSMPKWNPAKNGDRVQKSTYLLPVSFHILATEATTPKK
ncbi:TonB family protein [Aurantibacillus circumpalustris]|uniref:TonB family protein n=1 Tax=Aurantibacillus circumpalustris TaxID=3036359 RepID=UPI00295A5D3B|nr:TonB family protein [Aurantibacillus circumpalustris]